MIQYLTFSLILLLAVSHIGKCEKSSSSNIDEENKQQPLNEAATTHNLRQAEKKLARLNALYYLKRQDILSGLKSNVDEASSEESLETNFSDDDVYEELDRKRQHMDAKRSSNDDNNKKRGNNKRGSFFNTSWPQKPYRFQIIVFNFGSLPEPDNQLKKIWGFDTNVIYGLKNSVLE